MLRRNFGGSLKHEVEAYLLMDCYNLLSGVSKQHYKQTNQILTLPVEFYFDVPNTYHKQ